MAKRTTKRAPQDTTLRNLRAAKKREADFNKRLARLEAAMSLLCAGLHTIGRAIDPAAKRGWLNRRKRG
jgi:hypothetical protein